MIGSHLGRDRWATVSDADRSVGMRACGVSTAAIPINRYSLQPRQLSVKPMNFATTPSTSCSARPVARPHFLRKEEAASPPSAGPDRLSLLGLGGAYAEIRGRPWMVSWRRLTIAVRLKHARRSSPSSAPRSQIPDPRSPLLLGLRRERLAGGPLRSALDDDQHSRRRRQTAARAREDGVRRVRHDTAAVERMGPRSARARAHHFEIADRVAGRRRPGG